jgi:hypothetical protein
MLEWQTTSNVDAASTQVPVWCLSSRSVHWCDHGTAVPLAWPDVSGSDWWHVGATLRSGRLRWVQIVFLTACMLHFWTSEGVLTTFSLPDIRHLSAEHSLTTEVPNNGAVTSQQLLSCQSVTRCRFRFAGLMQPYCHSSLKEICGSEH